VRIAFEVEDINSFIVDSEAGEDASDIAARWMEENSEPDAERTTPAHAPS
jgi:hypothetical protein